MEVEVVEPNLVLVVQIHGTVLSISGVIDCVIDCPFVLSSVVNRRMLIEIFSSGYVSISTWTTIATAKSNRSNTKAFSRDLLPPCYSHLFRGPSPPQPSSSASSAHKTPDSTHNILLHLFPQTHPRRPVPRPSPSLQTLNSRSQGNLEPH